jgi:hypothetical protein
MRSLPPFQGELERRRYIAILLDGNVLWKTWTRRPDSFSLSGERIEEGGWRRGRVYLLNKEQRREYRRFLQRKGYQRL